MSPAPGGPVVVVGGGTADPGRAVTAALLAWGARVIVPVRTEPEAERFYLEADPAAVPRLRTAVGACDDPALPDRIAAVARREFGGVDHLVSVLAPPPLGALAALEPRAVRQAIEEGLSCPGAFLLGMLRHLGGAAPIKRVIAVVPAPVPAPGEPDAQALARTFLEGLVALLRETRRPGTEFHVVRAPWRAEAEARALGAEVVRLVAGGTAAAADDAY